MQWYSTTILFPDVTFLLLKVRDTENCLMNLFASRFGHTSRTIFKNNPMMRKPYASELILS